MNEIGMEVTISQPYENAINLVKSALRDEGFGVLTEIDVKATMKTKLNKDFRPYAILGACNPPLAYRALNSKPEIGLLLPCNVTIESIDSRASIIRFLDPKIMVTLGDMGENTALAEVATEAQESLKRVIESLSAWA